MNPTETKTKKFFKTQGILLSKISELETKTPDFEEKEILVEVKKVTPEKKDGCHPDSTYNAIKNNLRDAARKFRAHDPNHSKKHIVVIFSEDIIKEDIFSVWTGKWSPEQPEKIFSSGVTLSGNHNKHIDAVAWFERTSDAKPKYIWLSENKWSKDILKKYFTI